jgi:hypothetical protein
MAGALIFVSACESRGKLTVMFDSTLSRDSLEVVIAPIDPALALAARDRRQTPAQADSLRKLHALEDSAAKLDGTFQKLRDSLNAAAAEISKLDRRSEEYARRFDEFQPRAARAENLRNQRIRTTALAAEMRTRLLHLVPDSARIRRAAVAARQRLVALSDGARRTRVLAVRSDTLVVQLPHGDWWVGVTWNGLLPASFRRITLDQQSPAVVHFGPHPG